MERDVQDSTAAQEAINAESPAFTLDQRNRMSEAISLHMRASKSSSAAVQGQSNQWIFSYLTMAAWSAAFSKSIPWDTKLEYFCDILLALGLRNPDDTTVKLIIAILSVCHELKLEPQEAYNEVHSFKVKIGAKRQLCSGKQTLKVFPKDPADFMKLHPNIYGADDPPVPSKIQESVLRNMTRKDLMPTRSSNKFISKGAKQSPSSAITSPTNSSTNADAVLDYLLGHRGATNPRPRLEIREAPEPIAPPRVLALADAPIRPSRVLPHMPLALCDAGGPKLNEPPPPPTAVTAQHTVNDMLASARAALGNQQSTKGSNKVPPPDEDSEPSSVSESESSQSKEVADDSSDTPAVPAPMKKPAAADPKKKTSCGRF